MLSLVKSYGLSAWSRISKLVGHSEIKCSKRYLELHNLDELAVASWSPEEDLLLRRIVEEKGAKNWTQVALLFPGRIGKQCRDRWHQQLNPDVVRKKWTHEEDVLIVKLFLEHGSRWSEIAKHVPGRSDN